MLKARSPASGQQTICLSGPRLGASSHAEINMKRIDTFVGAMLFAFVGAHCGGDDTTNPAPPSGSQATSSTSSSTGKTSSGGSGGAGGSVDTGGGSPGSGGSGSGSGGSGGTTTSGSGGSGGTSSTSDAGAGPCVAGGACSVDKATCQAPNGDLCKCKGSQWSCENADGGIW